jgi:Tol biopolymer transport system component
MRPGRILRKPAVLLVLSLAVFAIIVNFIGRLARAPESGDSAKVLSSDQGGQPRRLTGGAGSDTAPAWSPDGLRIAFLRTKGEDSSCYVMLASGGAEQKIAACAAVTEEESGRALPSIDWSSDGKSVIATAPNGDQSPALSLIPLDGSSPKRLTDPPKGAGGDSTPAVSDDGRKLAFVRSTSGDGADIFICDLPACQPQRLTFEDRAVRGVTWTADGGSLIYAATRIGHWRLWRLPAAGGSAREVIVRGRSAQYPSNRKSRLVYAEGTTAPAIWRVQADAKDAGDAETVIRSGAPEWGPSWSPDGKRIANISEQSGAPEVWVSDAAGGNRVQLTHLEGKQHPSRPRWSPDGRSLAFALRGQGFPQIGVIPSNGGELKRIQVVAESPSWSGDGKSIYYHSRGQIWKAAPDGSKQTRLAEGFGTQPEEGPDGKYVYFRRYRAIWRVPANGGSEEEVEGTERDMIGSAPLQISPKGFYFAEWDRSDRKVVIGMQDWKTQKRVTLATLENADPSSYSVSPDGKSILFARTDRDETRLMLVDNFR